MNLVKDFDPQHVGVFADTGHLSIVGEPINMALDIVKSHLAVMAFKDLARSPGMGGGRVVRMGKGFVDWKDGSKHPTNPRIFRSCELP